MAEITGRVGWRNYVSPISPLWNNLVAYWSGDNTANDAKGTYNGTLVNGATYSTGKISNGFSFDGVNDYVNISPSLGSTFSKPSSVHSYSAWIYPTSLAGYNWIIQNGLNNSGTSMILNGANLCFFIQGGNNQTTSSATLTVNTWTMVTVVYNGAGSVSFYKNGVLSNSSSASWTETVAGTNTYIGSYIGATHFFDGKIDEVGAWNRALTATEVTELYNAGAGKQYVAPTPSIVSSGLILNLDASNAASYPGTGTVWTDLSGNGNNGTLINGTSYSSANGGTMVFDGINDNISFNFGTMWNLIPNRPNSVSVWCKFNNTNSRQILFGDWNSSGGTETSYLQIDGVSSTTMKFVGNLTSGNGGGQANDSINYISSNTWYYVTLQNTSATNTQMYINGVLQSEKTTMLAPYVGTGALRLGVAGNYPSLYLNGNISAFQVYNRTLSSTEVTQNFNAAKTRFGL